MLLRKILYITIIIIQIFSLHICYSQEYYEKGIYRLRRSDYQHGLVSGFDHIKMASMYLPGFTVSGSGPYNILWYSGITYLFVNSDNKRLLFTIGVYPTVMEAEETVLDYLNDSSAIFSEGSVGNIIIGDNSWYREGRFITPDNEEISGLESIRFIRKNAIVGVLSLLATPSNYYSDLLKLAESIDNDLVNGSSFITLSDTVNPPVIQSITVSDQKLEENEEALISLNATDPFNSKLLYRFHTNVGSGYRIGSDPENVYRIKANREIFPEPIIIVKVWVVNESNVFSSISEIKLTF